MVHLYKQPEIIELKENALERLPEICSKLGLERLYVFSGPTDTREIAETVIKILANSEYITPYQKIPVPIYAATEQNAIYVAQLLKRQKARGAVAVGGGVPIDVVKAGSHRMKIPYITIPTSPSNDSPASPTASLRRGTKYFYSTRVDPPIAVVEDLSILVNAPIESFRNGAGEVISKYSSVRDFEIARSFSRRFREKYPESLVRDFERRMIEATDGLSKKIDEMIDMNVNLQDRNSEYVKEFVSKIVEGINTSGIIMCLMGNTQMASGGEHLISHSIDMLQEYPGPHGQQCGMGTILTSYILENKYIDWRILKRRLEFIGAATKSKELGINDSVIIKAVGTEAKKLGEKRNRITVFELVEMNDKIAEDACRTTGVINNSMKE